MGFQFLQKINFLESQSFKISQKNKCARGLTPALLHTNKRIVPRPLGWFWVLELLWFERVHELLRLRTRVHLRMQRNS